jgi:hypothetical protein
VTTAITPSLSCASSPHCRKLALDTKPLTAAPTMNDLRSGLPATNYLVTIGSRTLPALVAAAGEHASMRFLEFFAANIRNPHTRRAYYRAATEFLAWCGDAGVRSIAGIQPIHVAAWIEAATRELAAPSVKQRLAVTRVTGAAGQSAGVSDDVSEFG